VKSLPQFQTLGFLVIATTLEVTGDAIVRIGLFHHAGMARAGIMLAGALLLLGYGWSLNLAPLEFRQVVGLYIATLFVVWQIVNAVIFRTYPTVPIVAGGLLILAGGLIVTFWNPAKPS
jgi:small multidrug resistance family-3 protein